MEQNIRKAYSEVCEILNMLEEEYASRVPEKIRSFFEEERDTEYKPTINANIPLEQQNLNRETMVVLAMLNLNYWCDSEEEKQELLNIFAENEKIKKQKQRELEEKYNPDNLFKKKEEKQETNNELSMIEYKEQTFIQKVLSKIKNFFKRRN